MPVIPTIKSKDTVIGSNRELDRSYSRVVASPESFGMLEGQAMARLAQTIGTSFASLGEAAQQMEARSRAENVVAFDAMNPLTPIALKAQQHAPPDGTGLADGTRDALRQGIDENSNAYLQMYPGDTKGAQALRMRQWGAADGLIQNSVTMQYGMRLKYSTDQTNTALTSINNQLRLDPNGYADAVKQSDDMIETSMAVPAAVKQEYRQMQHVSLANTLFEGKLLQAKTVADIEQVERDLTLGEDPVTGKKWSEVLATDSKPGTVNGPFEKLMSTIHSAKTTFASKATVEANAALDRYFKMSDGGATIDTSEMQGLQKLVENSGNGQAAIRFGQLVRNQEILTQDAKLTPAQIRTKANQMNGGAGMVYPGLPTEVSGYIGEASKQYPGVSASYLGATAVREYGGNFPANAGRIHVDSRYQPAPAHKGVDMADVRPDVRDNLALAGEAFGRPLVISSGYRSQEHQDRIRFSGDPNRMSVAKHSHHTEGSAVDISTAGMDEATKAKMVDSLVQAGFTGFGEYGSHIHADLRENVPSSFRHGFGGWTNLSPEVSAVLEKRGFAGGKGAQYIDRSGPIALVRGQPDRTVPVDYGKREQTTSATGLYQFTDGTWADMVKRPDMRDAFKANGYDLDKMNAQQISDLRKDPRASTLAAAAFATKNKSTVEQALGREIGDNELYMAHFMGAGGATAFLRAYSVDKNQSAVALNPQAAEANKSIYYRPNGQPRTVGEVYDRITTLYGTMPSQVAYTGAEFRRKNADTLEKNLHENPHGTAVRTGVITQAPLANDTASWQARGQNVRKVAEYYQLPAESAAKPFDADTEVQGLKKQIADGTSEQVAMMLKNMAAMDAIAPGSMNAGLTQLGEKHTAYGVAGDLMQRGNAEDAVAVVQGAKALSDDKNAAHAALKVPGGGAGAAETWNTTTRNALRGIPAEDRDALYKAANAHYVTLQAPNVDQFSPDLYKKSIQAVLGGGATGERIGNVNGQDSVLPAGVKADEMNKAVDKIDAADLVKYSVGIDGKPNAAAPRYSDGTVVEPYQISAYGKFDYIGADTYEIRMSDNSKLLQPSLSPNGRPYPYRIRMTADAVKEIAAKPQAPGSMAYEFGKSLSGPF